MAIKDLNKSPSPPPNADALSDTSSAVQPQQPQQQQTVKHSIKDGKTCKAKLWMNVPNDWRGITLLSSSCRNHIWTHLTENGRPRNGAGVRLSLEHYRLESFGNKDKKPSVSGGGLLLVRWTPHSEKVRWLTCFIACSYLGVSFSSPKATIRQNLYRYTLK